MDFCFAEMQPPLSERLPIVMYTNLFDACPTAVWMSPQVERLTGYSAGEWVGSQGFFESVLHPDDRDVVMEDVCSSRRELRPFALDYRLLRRDGTVMWIHDESFPVLNAVGIPELVQGYFVDITSRKEMEEQLLHAQKMNALGRLATEVAHDFNNHLTAIQGHAGLLATLLAEDSPAQIHAQEIVTATSRAAALTRRVLDYGRREQSRRRAVSMTDLIAEREPMLACVAGPNVDLRMRLRPTRPVFADPTQLEQVVVNLVANARDAMPDGGAVSVAAYDVHVRGGATAGRLGLAAGDWVALVIADKGPGIDPATQRRVFEPFFTTKPGGRGTGLGLSIVDRVVRAAGGAIQLQSAPGRGSRFRIFLPAMATCRNDLPIRSDGSCPTHPAARASRRTEPMRSSNTANGRHHHAETPSR